MATTLNPDTMQPYPPRVGPQAPPIATHRMSHETYAQLARQCPVIAVTNDTSAHQAGFQLGVQHVLQKLREGFVVGE